MEQQEPKKYYNPDTSEYVDKKGQLPPEYREIVRQLNGFGILEKRLINKVLRGEKSLEQLIEECKASAPLGQVSKNLLSQEEKAKLFEMENPWLTILNRFGCEISKEQSADQIRDIILSVFITYYTKRQYFPLLQKLYEKWHGSRKAEEFFEKLLSFSSKLGALNSYSQLYLLLNELRERFLEVFTSESETLSVAEEVSRRKFYDILRLDFEKFNYVEGFTEEERSELQASLESLFSSEDVSDLTKQIQKKLEISINNIKKRFLAWHDQLYIQVGYYEKLEEYSRLKSELGSILRSNPSYALDDGIYAAYAYFAAYRPIKAGHLSVKKINVANTINHRFELRCQVCHIESSLSELHSKIGEFQEGQTFQKFAELQTRIPEGEALLRWLQTNSQQASVQIAGIELAVDSLRKLFSSIKSVDNKYGIKYFADVLKGSQNKKIVERKGQKLPAYRLLSKSRPADIEEMLDELVRRELLWINEYHNRGVYYPLVNLAERAYLFLGPVAKTEKPRDVLQIKDQTPVVFDKNTIVRTFSQFDNKAKSWILEKLAKGQEITILKELFRNIEGEEKQSLVENAIKNLNQPILEPFLLSLFNIENEGKNENIEKLKLTLCDYFLQHPDKRLSPIFQLKIAQEKNATVKKKLQEIATLCYMP